MVVLMDEMHIRESLVYDKVSGILYNRKGLCITIHVGALVGFANLGEINTHLSSFQQQMKSSSTPYKQPLAKTMLVLMVRGLNSGLQFPYAQLPCSNLSGD